MREYYYSYDERSWPKLEYAVVTFEPCASAIVQGWGMPAAVLNPSGRMTAACDWSTLIVRWIVLRG